MRQVFTTHAVPPCCNFAIRTICVLWKEFKFLEVGSWAWSLYGNHRVCIQFKFPCDLNLNYKELDFYVTVGLYAGRSRYKYFSLEYVCWLSIWKEWKRLHLVNCIRQEGSVWMTNASRYLYSRTELTIPIKILIYCSLSWFPRNNALKVDL